MLIDNMSSSNSSKFKTAYFEFMIDGEQCVNGGFSNCSLFTLLKSEKKIVKMMNSKLNAIRFGHEPGRGAGGMEGEAP